MILYTLKHTYIIVYVSLYRVCMYLCVCSEFRKPIATQPKLVHGSQPVQRARWTRATKGPHWGTRSKASPFGYTVNLRWEQKPTDAKSDVQSSDSPQVCRIDNNSEYSAHVSTCVWPTCPVVSHVSYEETHQGKSGSISRLFGNSLFERCTSVREHNLIFILHTVVSSQNLRPPSEFTFEGGVGVLPSALPHAKQLAWDTGSPWQRGLKILSNVI